MTTLTLDSWHSSGQSFNWQGHNIFWQQAGSGPPLLLIHGFPTASWDFHHQWPELAATYNVITFDMLGFGYSDKPRGHAYSMVEQADIACALLNQLDVSTYHMVAHDYGDSVGQELLARSNLNETGAPKILSACFLNGGMFPSLHRPTFRQKVLHSPVGGLMARLMSKRGFASSFGEVFGPNTKPTAQEIDDFWLLISLQNGQQALAKLINYIDERRVQEERWVSALKQAEIPMLLINGPEDPVSGGHAADYFEQQVPQASVLRLPGIGHYPQVEAPAAVTAAASNFFAAACHIA